MNSSKVSLTLREHSDETVEIFIAPYMSSEVLAHRASHILVLVKRLRIKW